MGSSGCGKTTLMETVCGTREGGRMAGTVHLVGGISDPRDTVGFVRSSPVLIESLTTAETLCFRLALTSLSNQQRALRFWDTVSALELEGALDVPLRVCSDGQRRRVGIALTLLLDYEVIALDEPTTGLDGTTALNLGRLLKRLAESGRTIVASIHQPARPLLMLCDELIVLSDGAMFAAGTVPSIVEEFGAADGEDLGSCILESLLKRISDRKDFERMAARVRQKERSKANNALNAIKGLNRVLSIGPDDTGGATEAGNKFRYHSHTLNPMANVPAMVYELLVKAYDDFKSYARFSLVMVLINLAVGIAFLDLSVETPADAFIAASITTITALVNIVIVGHYVAVSLNKTMATSFEDIRVGARPVFAHVVAVFVACIMPSTILPIPVAYAVSYFALGISEDPFMFFIATLNLVLAAEAWNSLAVLALWLFNGNFRLWNNRCGQLHPCLATNTPPRCLLLPFVA